ncbi:hypothetical protein [Alloyangia pacifica]|uniref:hypothetical protein n=1 Tax=Alloyangia pacifica TaxID=311180 RepID=UPI001CFEE0FB|nr:hypothetical protein [Alloyangia pacifica]
MQEAPSPDASDDADSAFANLVQDDSARHAVPVAARLVPSEEEVAETARRAPLRDVGATAEPAERPAVDTVEEAPFIEVEDADAFSEASIADFFALKLQGSASPQPEPAAEPAAKEGSLAQKIAELEEMIARSTHDFEPERGEEAPEAIFRHQPADAAEPAAQGAPVVAAEDEDPELASRPMPEPELVDEPYQLETLAEPQSDESSDDEDLAQDAGQDIEQDIDLGVTEAGEAEEAQDDALAVEPDPAPVRRPVKILRNPVWQRSQSNLRSETPAPEAPAPDAALPAGLDEDRLRALITEVVREELQGALGERATRNVRKMVRRELQRLLASDDQD